MGGGQPTNLRKPITVDSNAVTDAIMGKGVIVYESPMAADPVGDAFLQQPSKTGGVTGFIEQ